MDELFNKRILVVDDEPELLQIISDGLFRAGFFYVLTAQNCHEALSVAQSQPIALYILDINLPDGNGFALFRDIRAASSKAPIIFLTARGEADDRIQGFELGADDYIVKPFLVRELVLRVTALLRRSYATESPVTMLRLSDRTVDFSTASVIYREKHIPLTAKEFILIKKLFENRNKIVTNDALCMAAWGDHYYSYENSLMVHIRRLREKIETNPSRPQHLITIKGLGYKLVTIV